jgi:NTE family protein
MRRRPKLGLALGAGGARGLAHIGVLKALQQEDIPIDFIAGSSIGALMGAVYAANPDAPALVKQVSEVLDPRSKKEICLKWLERSYWEENFKPDVLHRIVRIVQKEYFLSLALFKSAVLSEQDLRMTVEAFVPDIAIEDTRIPYCAIATDLLSGRPVVLKQGSLVRAVMASCAVPGFMPSIDWHGKLLVDGGLVHMIPVTAVRNICAGSRVVGVDVGSILKRNHPVEDGIDAIHRATEIMDFYLGAADRLNADVIIEPVVGDFGWTDFLAFEKLIHQGELAVELKINAIKNILKPHL